VSPPRYFPWPDSSGPIAVEGGIKAKSKRGVIGERWWSKRFIALLESYGMSGRLQRGRSYARKGQVLEFELASGKVTALVQGSRPQPYKVSLGVRPLTAAQWRTVEQRLASQALFRAKLLAGEMPVEIEQVFADCGTPLFPESAADLDMRCNCPDWSVPCKHLAAVCYVLAEAFDDDPFGMLAWRGQSRDSLLAALRQRGGGAGAGRAAGAGSVAGAGSAAALAAAAGAGTAGAGTEGAGGGNASNAGVGNASATRLALGDVTGPPPAQSLAGFWSPGLSQAKLRALAAPAPAPAAPDLLLRMFEPPPVTVRGRDLRDVLAPAYEQLAELAGPLAISLSRPD